MHEDSTPGAQAVLERARLEARALNHDRVGTEHLLIGLVSEEQSAAARALSSVGVGEEGIREQLARLKPAGDEPVEAETPFSSRAKEVLGLTREEAGAAGHSFVSTEHILLALLRCGEGTALRILSELGAATEDIRSSIATGRGPSSPSARESPPVPVVRTALLERFTHRARCVVLLAQEEARMLKHDYIGTEHILLGLLSEEDGVAARVLGSLDVTVERVRAQVVRIAGRGDETAGVETPATPRVLKVLDLTLREALSLGHNYVGTEHILLGLVRENEGVAARILLDFDADPEEIRDEVFRTLRDQGGSRRSKAWAAEPSPESMRLSDSLLDGAGPPLRVLTREVRERSKRRLDAGDLLVLLASVPDGLAARTLAAVGIDPERLGEAVEHQRGTGTRSALLPDPGRVSEIEEVRRARHNDLLEEVKAAALARLGLD